MLRKRLIRLKKHKNYEEFLVSPQIIEASYIRCEDRKIPFDMTEIPQVHHHSHTGNLLEGSQPLRGAAWPVMKDDLYPSLIDNKGLIILCNLEGYVIALMSSPSVLNLCHSMNIGVGSCFSEESCGTNAISLAMLLKKTVAIRGTQHYCRLFKDWSCVAEPVQSPDGDIIGYLALHTDSEEKLGQALVLVQLAVKYIEAKLNVERLLAELTPKTSILMEGPNEYTAVSPRERQAIRLMADGQTAREVAEAMKISYETVKTHRQKIYKKLGVNRKSECLKKARELGLLDE